MLFFGSASIQADTLCTYQARLSEEDHVNSQGQPLFSVAAIIRQDRFWFYGPGPHDKEDSADCFFKSKANRELLERILERGVMSEAARRAIVERAPLVAVRIFRDKGDTRVDVRIIRDEPP
jgi:hypothetical protein